MSFLFPFFFLVRLSKNKTDCKKKRKKRDAFHSFSKSLSLFSLSFSTLLWRFFFTQQRKINSNSLEKRNERKQPQQETKKNFPFLPYFLFPCLLFPLRMCVLRLPFSKKEDTKIFTLRNGRESVFWVVDGAGWEIVFNTSLFFLLRPLDLDLFRSVSSSLFIHFFYPDPWQQQHLAYALTSEPPAHAVCSQNLLEPQPVGTAAMVAAQSWARTADEANKKKRARRAARRRESEDFIFCVAFCRTVGIFLCCLSETEAGLRGGGGDEDRRDRVSFSLLSFEALCCSEMGERLVVFFFCSVRQRGHKAVAASPFFLLNARIGTSWFDLSSDMRIGRERGTKRLASDSHICHQASHQPLAFKGPRGGSGGSLFP